jgi:two-component sensor histidine kinase
MRPSSPAPWRRESRHDSARDKSPANGDNAMQADTAKPERAAADRHQTRHRSRLRKVYFAAAAVLAALIPLIILGGLWLRSELRESQRDLAEFLASRAGALSQRVDADIQQEITVLQALAALPSLDGPDLAAFHGQMLRLVSAMPEWAYLSLAAPEGRQLINSLRPTGEPLPPLDAELMRRVTETRRPLVDPNFAVSNDALYPGPTILLCVPVVRDGLAKLVLVAAVKLDHLQRLVREQASDPRLLSVLVDDRGTILARSHGAERFVGKEANNSLRDQTAGRVSGIFSASTLDDRDVMTTFQRSPVTGWMAVVAADRSHFDQLASRSTWATVAAGLLSLTLAAILAVFIVYNVVERRITRERLAASRALGDLDTRLLATTQEALAEQRKAASEREVLLREIYHRVKNNLQIVQSLLRLGSRDLNDEQREPFENAVRRIGAMARVHTLLYNSPDLASIDFKEYLDGLVREIADAFGAEERGITTVVEAEPMRIPLDTAVPVAFIATELLTNAYKHAFPGERRGSITVAAGRENGKGVITIMDNGVGLPADGSSKRPLGLTIVAKLVQQIAGTLDEPGPGESRFRVTFPLDGTTPAAGSEKRPIRAQA